MYCNLNYSREKVHKYKFVERFEARDACRGECEKELRAAEAIITMNNRKQQWSNQPGTFRSELHERRSVEQEMLKASVILKRKQRQIARLAAEERLDLRNDLNTLLSEIREQLVTFYPYNEHLSRLARRLDKISTHQEMWAKYRPKLVQLHLAGFLQKWEDAGCPLRPHKLLQPTAPAEADNFNNDVEEVYMEEPFNFGGEKTGSAGPQIHEQQQKADGYPKATKGAQEGRLPQESGTALFDVQNARKLFIRTSRLALIKASAYDCVFVILTYMSVHSRNVYVNVPEYTRTRVPASALTSSTLKRVLLVYTRD